MNWMDSSETYRDHRAETRKAVALYREMNPGQRVDVTAAQEEYAIIQGLPRNYYKLGTAGRIVTPKRLEIAIRILPPFCPECGSRLTWEKMPACGSVNPKRYSGAFICESDDCLYHALVKDGMVDTFNKIRAGRYDTINLEVPIL